MKPKEERNGSEIHRLTGMPENYDRELFQRLYRVTRPVIRNLTRTIDNRRFNVTPDIIASYFDDKFLFVFNKYYGTCSEEHLQANILRALSTFKNKLLRSAYGEKAEYNQSLTSMEDLFDNSKELEDDSEEVEVKEEHMKMIEDYMRKNLSPDAFLIFQLTMDPPEVLLPTDERGKRIPNITFVDFFELPRTRSSVNYIADLRKDIEYWIHQAQEELKY